MTQAVLRSPDQELRVGDRVRVQQGTEAISTFIGRLGIIVELFRVPEGSCMVHIDGDRDLQRNWFFYANELVHSDI